MSLHEKKDYPVKLGPWQKNSSKQAYENPWIEVFHEAVTSPGGSEGIYGRVHFKGQAVGIVPVDEEANTFLVKQYRYTLEENSWEIPMGGCARTEPTEAAAYRELEEETGLIAHQLIKLGDYHTSNSITDEKGCAYLALGLQKGMQQLEKTEADLEVLKLPLTEALDWIDQGKITDCISVAALLQAERFFHQHKL